jgi:hypothetical protein
MLSCREIARLASEQMDSGAELPLGTRMSMRLHLMMCKYCSRYVRQIRLIGDLTGRYTVERLQDGEEPAPMPAEARERLTRQVRDAIDE